MDVRDLALLKQNVVQILAATRGDFDKEIAALSAAVIEWDTRNNLGAVQAKVDASYADIAERKASVEAQAADHETRLNDYSDSLRDREVHLKERETVVAALQLELSNRIDKLDIEQRSFKANADIMNADLVDKLTKVEVALEEWTVRLDVLSKREAKVKAAAAMVN